MKLEKCAQLLHGEWLYCQEKDLQREIRHICIDSREVQKGDAFLAIIGKNQNGHHYIDEVIEKKPSLIIVSQKEFVPARKVPILWVPDTLNALQELAFKKRQSHAIPVIAITGSAGKTTTKELIAHFLSLRYQVCKNPKNFNNHIGVPLTLLQLKDTDEVAVLELGMNHAQELSQLSKLCRPDLAVITNIGTSHIGNLGTKKNIWKAKMEITHGIQDGLLIVNGDDRYLKKCRKKKQYDICYCGLHNYTSLKVQNVKTSMCGTTFEICEKDTWYSVYFPIPGKHLLIDLLIAFQIGLYFQIPLGEMIHSLSQFQMQQNRMEIIKVRDNILISDCYNASYDSFVGVFDLLKQEPQAKTLILGDMLELAQHSKKYHQKLAKKIKKMQDITVYLIGTEVKYMLPILKNAHYYSSKEEFISKVNVKKIEHQIILIKGANALKLQDLKSYF